MNNDHEAHEDVIDLGAASVETQGSLGSEIDVFATQPRAGIVDEG